MEIEFSSYRLDERERFYSQSVLVFLLALGLILWANFVVLANPSSSSSIAEDSRVPLSKRVFDSSGQWRAPQKPKSKWRESEEEKLTIQNDRIKKKTSSLYNPSLGQDNWDPYASPGHPDNQTTPATLFKFKF